MSCECMRPPAAITAQRSSVKSIMFFHLVVPVPATTQTSRQDSLFGMGLACSAADQDQLCLIAAASTTSQHPYEHAMMFEPSMRTHNVATGKVAVRCFELLHICTDVYMYSTWKQQHSAWRSRSG